MTDHEFSVRLTPELVDAIAERAAAIVLERVATKQPAASKYVTVDEAAELYRCEKQRIYELVSAGRLSRVKDGGRLLLLREELEARLELDASLATRRAVI